MPFVTFDLMPTEYTTEMAFQFSDDYQAYHGPLEEIGYDSCNFLLNSGSMILFLMILVLRYVLYYFMKAVNMSTNKKYTKLVKFAKELESKLFWGNFIMFLSTAYIEFGVSTYIAIV